MRIRLFLIVVLTILVTFTIQFVFAKDFNDTTNSQEDDSTVEEDTTMSEDDGVSDIEIYINVAARRLYLYNAGELVKVYPVATGMAIYPTPIGGRYPVIHAISNPDWTPPNSPWAAGEHYQPPGPKSATGIAKLYLRSPGLHIHGTPKDYSIGTFASHSCIRMYNSDAVELLEYVLDNTAHTKPGRYNEMSNEEYFEWVKNHPYTKFTAQMNEVVYVYTYYKRVEILDGQLLIAKDGYHRGGDVLQMIEDELVSAGYKIENLDWDYLAQEIRNVKEDLSFDLEELGAKATKRVGRVQGPGMEEMM